MLGTCVTTGMPAADGEFAMPVTRCAFYLDPCADGPRIRWILLQLYLQPITGVAGNVLIDLKVVAAIDDDQIQ